METSRCLYGIIGRGSHHRALNKRLFIRILITQIFPNPQRTCIIRALIITHFQLFPRILIIWKGLLTCFGNCPINRFLINFSTSITYFIQFVKIRWLTSFLNIFQGQMYKNYNKDIILITLLDLNILSRDHFDLHFCGCDGRRSCV